MRLVTRLVLCAFLCRCAAGADILGLFYPATMSNHILGEALMKGFARRGHNITFVSAYKLKRPVENLTHIYLDGMVDVFNGYKARLQNSNPWMLMYTLDKFIELTNEVTLQNEGIRQLRRSGAKFDVVIGARFFSDAFGGLAHEFGAQMVAFSPSHSVLLNHLSGNAAPFSFVPGLSSPYADAMSFAQRLHNAALGTLDYVLRKLYLESTQRNIYRKYFENGPDLDELERNISLFLINTHTSLESPRPYTPNMIQIGGFHVEDAQELPKNIQEYLDGAVDGAIYCSLGSNIKTAAIPEAIAQAFAASFANIRQKVLWKWDDRWSALSNNVRTAKWLPQRDILAHPNVKLFITHGGLLSTFEAIKNGVPMIGVPFFGDQQLNVRAVANGGFGIGIPPDELTERTLTGAIREIIANPAYGEEVKKRREIFLDRPMKPLDTAIYWVENIIRHKSGKHLRCAGTYLNSFQYWLLDVIAFSLTILLLLCTTIRWACKKALKKFSELGFKNKED